MQATDYNFYLPEVMMTKIDRASMANSLEIRSPFVDHKLIEYILSVKSTGYTATRNKKKPLKKFLNDDFDNDFLNRKKMGFAVPLDTWIKSSLREEVFNVLDNKDSYVKQELNFDTSNLFNKLEQGQKSYKNRIWKLYVLEKNIQKYLSLLH